MTLQRPSDEVNQHPYEYGVIIDGADPLKVLPSFAGLLSGRNVQVVEDFYVTANKTDGRHQNT